MHLGQHILLIAEHASRDDQGKEGHAIIGCVL